MNSVGKPGTGASGGKQGLEVARVAGSIGAQVRGLRLSGELDAATVAALRASLLEHKVLFFRDQQHLDDAAQEAFAAHFGELQKHPMVAAAGGSAALLELTEGYSASVWHTDLTFVTEPSAFAILRPVELPPCGGDTLWANAAAAYQRLPAPLRVLADELWAIHATDFDFDGNFSDAYKAKMKNYGANTAKHVDQVEHPVVHVHPETGERSLILGSWVKRFVGLNNAESAKIFEILQSYITMPENTVRWHWQLGDVAMWDNRATQHRAVPDYGDAPRVLRRATVLGSVPVAIDGRGSHRRVA
ncbi:TauD/TfdA family dioxygenase [Mangrovimicrobium sediminis]|uniref:TauD/TfdA family dioxygenase n=1 Tax=Mangrovimicrobium sediminis TaxID=2562682 RepID=A0A4Z0M0K4_9GAMM|nr:TauD/TfdA family dioxygenase [Haliea sp. SAOS-164]TGD73020.1 TauD/TfdA family dioxygenase [Haliea sp. SAOS-164]